MMNRLLRRCALLLVPVTTVAINACGATDEGPAGAAPTGDPVVTGTPTSTAPPTPPTQDPDAGALEAGLPANPYGGGAPIVAPAETWTYVPMDDVVCGNGTKSGVAVNMSKSAGAPLLVFMMGGGACWNALTCLGGTAASLSDAVGEAEIFAVIPRVATLFDRAATDNPFRDASFVFVPYCTGDLHAGDAVQTYSFPTKKSQTIQHRGARNTDAIVKRLLATVPAPPKIWLTGASAGGYGVMLSHHRFKAAWPVTRIDLLDDSGPPVQPSGSTWKDMQKSWSLELPPGCTNCAADATNLLPHLAATMGQGRFALLQYTEDKTIRSFTGKLLPQDFAKDVLTIRAAMTATQRAFLVKGDSHVLITQKPQPVAPSGVGLSTWLTRFATDDPAWAHEGP